MNDIENLPFDQIKYVTQDANEMWLIWKSFFIDTLNKHAPVTKITVQNNRLPYVTPDLKKLLRQSDYLRGKANKTGSKYLRQAFQQMARANFELKKARREFFSNKIEQQKDNLKGMWKVLKKAVGQENKLNSIDQIQFHETTITDNKEIADVCNQHFVTIGERLASKIPGTSGLSNDHIPRVQPITETQVLQVIAKWVNSKATGLDGIPNRALKYCAEVITPSLTFIFNFSVITKIFPDDLKVAKVAPVFKKGERDDLGNYRPISVLPTVARVFEKLIFDQLFQYFSENELLGNEQYEFRSLYSTALALGKVTNSWLSNIDNGKMNSAVFLDIRDAFDTVDHKILLDKLKCYGMPENEITFFSSYLDNRQQCCHVNGMTSSTRKITCGVPQGSIVGPLLFIIYMNDLPLFVKDAEITMYADDTSLLKAFSTINQLQEELIPAFAKVCE